MTESLNDDVFSGLGIEIKLKKPEDFLKVKETLTRIGIASVHQKSLYQSCHLLHKRGRYSILHFKELFKLDNRPADFSDNDCARRNTIVNMLASWNLLDLVEPERSKSPVVPISSIKVLTHKEKPEWTLCAKYTVGKKKTMKEGEENDETNTESIPN